MQHVGPDEGCGDVGGERRRRKKAKGMVLNLAARPPDSLNDGWVSKTVSRGNRGNGEESRGIYVLSVRAIRKGLVRHATQKWRIQLSELLAKHRTL